MSQSASTRAEKLWYWKNSSFCFMYSIYSKNHDQKVDQVETVNFSLRCIYLSCKVLYFILSDDDFEIKPKIYSFNLRLVLKHILHSQDVFFRNLLFIVLDLNPIFANQDPLPL